MMYTNSTAIPTILLCTVVVSMLCKSSAPMVLTSSTVGLIKLIKRTNSCQSSFVGSFTLVVKNPIVVSKSGLLLLDDHNVFITYLRKKLVNFSHRCFASLFTLKSHDAAGVVYTRLRVMPVSSSKSVIITRKNWTVPMSTFPSSRKNI